MANEFKEVTLRIRADDLASKSFQEIADHADELIDKQKELNKINDASVLSVSDLEKQYGSLKKTMENIGARIGKMRGIQASEENIDDLNSKLAKAKERFSELSEERKKAEEETGKIPKQTEEYKSVTRSIKKMEGAIARGTEKLAKMRSVVAATGVDMGDLSGEIAKAQDVQRKIVDAAEENYQLQQKTTIAKLKAAEAAKEQAKAEEKAAKAARAADIGRIADELEAVSTSAIPAAKNVSEASDAIKAIIEPAAAARKTLEGLEVQIDDLSASAKDAASSTEQISKSSAGLKSAIGAAKGIANQIDAYREQEAVVDGLKIKQAEQVEMIRKLSKEMADSDDNASAFNDRIRAARDASSKLKAEMEREVKALSGMGEGLHQAGIDTNDLGAAQDRLVTSAKKVNDALQEIEQTRAKAAAREKEEGEEGAKAKRASERAEKAAKDAEKFAAKMAKAKAAMLDAGKAGNVAAESFSDVHDAVVDILNPAEVARKTLSGLVDEIEEAGKMIAKADSVSDIGARIKKNETAIRSMAELIDSYRRSMVEVARLSKEFDKATDDLNQLTEAFRRGAISQDQYDDESEDLRAELNRIAKELGNAKAGADKYGESLRKAGVDTNNLEEAQRELANAAGSVTKQLDGLTKRMKVIGSDRSILSWSSRVRSELIALGLQFAGLQASIELTTGVIDTARMVDAFESQMLVVHEDIALAEEEWEYLAEFAKEVGLDLKTLATQFPKFMVSATQGGFGIEQARYVFEQFAKAAKTYRFSADQTERMFTALGQIVSKGQVYSEELKGQLGEVLPGVFGQTAEALGVTTKELSKLLEEGAIDAQALLNLAAKLGEQSAKVVENRRAEDVNINESINNLSTAYTLFLDKISEAGALEALDDAIRSITEALESDAGSQFARDISTIIEAVASLGGAIAEFVQEYYTQIKMILSLAVASRVVANIGLIGTSIFNLIKWIGRLIIPINLVTTAFRGLGAAVMFATNPWGALALAIGGIAIAVADSMGWLDQLGDWFSETFPDLSKWVDKLMELTGFSEKIDVEYIKSNLAEAGGAGPFAQGSFLPASIKPEVAGPLTTEARERLIESGDVEIPSPIRISATQSQAAVEKFAKESANKMEAAKVRAAQDSLPELLALDAKRYDAQYEQIDELAAKERAALVGTGKMSSKVLDDLAAQRKQLDDARKKSQEATIMDFERKAEKSASRVGKSYSDTFADVMKRLENMHAQAVRELGKVDISKDMQTREDEFVAAATTAEKFADVLEKINKLKEEDRQKAIAQYKEIVELSQQAAKIKFQQTESRRLDKEARITSQTWKMEAEEIRRMMERGELTVEQANARIIEINKAQSSSLTKTINLMEELFNKVDKATNPELWAAMKAEIDEVKASMEGVNKYAEDFAENMVAGATGAVNVALADIRDSIGEIIDGTADWEDAIESLGETMAKFFSDLLLKMAQAIAQQMILDELAEFQGPGIKGRIGRIAREKGGVAGGAKAVSEVTGDIAVGTAGVDTDALEKEFDYEFGSVIKKIGNGFKDLLEWIAKAFKGLFGGIFDMIGIPGLKLFHSGGLVGGGSGQQMRYGAAPSAFMGAPRYHTGGIAGFAANEVPAVLQRGEEVLTRSDPRHILNGGITPNSGGGSNVNIALFDDRQKMANWLNTKEGKDAIMGVLKSERTTLRHLSK